MTIHVSPEPPPPDQPELSSFSFVLSQYYYPLVFFFAIVLCIIDLASPDVVSLPARYLWRLSQGLARKACGAAKFMCIRRGEGKPNPAPDKDSNAEADVPISTKFATDEKIKKACEANRKLLEQLRTTEQAFWGAKVSKEELLAQKDNEIRTTCQENEALNQRLQVIKQELHEVKGTKGPLYKEQEGEILRLCTELKAMNESLHDTEKELRNTTISRDALLRQKDNEMQTTCQEIEALNERCRIFEQEFQEAQSTREKFIEEVKGVSQDNKALTKDLEASQQKLQAAIAANEKKLRKRDSEIAKAQGEKLALDQRLLTTEQALQDANATETKRAQKDVDTTEVRDENKALSRRLHANEQALAAKNKELKTKEDEFHTANQTTRKVRKHFYRLYNAMVSRLLTQEEQKILNSLMDKSPIAHSHVDGRTIKEECAKFSWQMEQLGRAREMLLEERNNLMRNAERNADANRRLICQNEQLIRRINELTEAFRSS